MSGAAVGGTQAGVPAPALRVPSPLPPPGKAGEHWELGGSGTAPSRLFSLPAALVRCIPKAWSDPKLPWKALHGSSASGALVLAVLGLPPFSLSLFLPFYPHLARPFFFNFPTLFSVPFPLTSSPVISPFSRPFSSHVSRSFSPHVFSPFSLIFPTLFLYLFLPLPHHISCSFLSPFAPQLSQVSPHLFPHLNPAAAPVAPTAPIDLRAPIAPHSPSVEGLKLPFSPPCSFC